MVQVIIWVFVPHIHIQSRNANQSKNISRNKRIVKENYIITQRLNKNAEVLHVQLKTSLFKSESKEEICTKHQKLTIL